ncbi:MAG: hypothetical protein AAB383_00365 [Patescibacteria group bacterium]
MKKTLLALSLFTLVLASCEVRTKSNEEEAALPPAELVELSSEGELVPLMLEASFMSDHQSFSYSLSYDGNLLKLMDTDLQGSSVAGPDFKVEGGTEITGYTEWLSELDVVPQLAASQLWGRYQVYRYTVPDGICSLDKAVIQHKEEGLVLQVRTCSDQDGVQGKEALEALLTGLRLQDL